MGLALTLAGAAHAQTGSDTPTAESSPTLTPSSEPVAPEGTPPAAEAAAAAPESTDIRPGWFGMGIRFGIQGFNLSAGNAPLIGAQLQEAITNLNAAVTAYNAANPGSPVAPYSINDMNIAQSVFTITPTFHLGGDGYFFKFDVPIGLGGNITTLGLGIYPINYGYYIENIRLMPYLSLGATFNYAMSSGYTPPGGGATTAMNGVGALISGRLALGAKYQIMNGLAAGLELGWSPFAAGGVVDATRLAAIGGSTTLPPAPGSIARGGLGSILDGAISIDWL
jgi:hypothetical protein